MVKVSYREIYEEVFGVSEEEKEKLLSQVYAQLDKAAKNHVIHKRTASRRKARLAAYFNKEKADK